MYVCTTKHVANKKWHRRIKHPSHPDYLGYINIQWIFYKLTCFFIL
jgi:hypothetical protein